MRTRDWAAVDFYAVLGVVPTASAEEIGTAFRSLAKQLHPDRSGATAGDSERFKSVTAAYEVVGDPRLRRNYDQVRMESAATAVIAPAAPRAPATAATTAGRVVAPETLRRNGRRWLAGGVAVFVIGIVVTVLVVHLQVDERARRAGRVKTEAVLLVAPAGNTVEFATHAGAVVQVPEPTRVNPGTERDGQHIAVLYRPDRPDDVIIDESTTARDITLWIVALKMLVGGVVFSVVGIRKLRAATAGPARAPARA